MSSSALKRSVDEQQALQEPVNITRKNVKWISFRGSQRPIIVLPVRSDVVGPLPSVANVLLLRGDLALSHNQQVAGLSYLHLKNKMKCYY